MSPEIQEILPGIVGPEAAAAAGGFAVLAAFIGLYLLLVPHVVDRRISDYVGSLRSRVAPRTTDSASGSTQIMEAIERQVLRRKASASVRMLLLRAGLEITVSEFIALRLISALFFGAFVGLVLASRIGLALGIILALLTALLGSLLPIAVTRIMARNRLIKLETQLPDALDMAAASLQAGSGLGQAFDLISREMARPISQEFGRVMQEVALGLSLTEALSNMADRVNSEDLDLAVTSINIQSRVGGNLVQVLHIISATIRERLRIRGEIRVLTATQRYSGAVISILPPALATMLFLMNPSYMSRLLDPGVTRCLLVIGVVMMLAGIYSLRKITQIEI